MSTPPTETLGAIGSSGAAAQSVEAPLAQRFTAPAAMALVALSFLLYWPTTAALMERWEDTVHRTYTHGYLILILSLWMMWRERSVLPAPRASLFGAAALVLGGVLWLIAVRAGLQIVHQAMLPALAAAAVLACCGWKTIRQLWLPLGYLYFAVPVWDALNPLLQWISVFAVRALLRVVGIPAFFAENTFQIPAGAFEIADGCSGLHFFIVGVAIAVLYGAVNRDTMSTRIKLVAFAALLAMATNWLRIFIIVLAGHLTDMQHYLVSGEHYTFGWVMFAVSMILFFLVVRRWPLEDLGALRARTDDDSQVRFPYVGATVAIVGLAAAPLWHVLDRAAAPSTTPHSLPEFVEGWTSEAPTTRWAPRFDGADLEERREFVSDTARVEAYAAIYLHQEQGKEIAGYENSVLGESMRSIGGIIKADSPPWAEMRAHDTDSEQWLVRFAYRIDDRWYGSALRAQLAYGFRSLFGTPLSSVIVVRSKCEGDCGAARANLSQFEPAAAAWNRGRHGV